MILEFTLDVGKDRTYECTYLIKRFVSQLTRIEYVHDCNLLHRDLKPANLVVGRPSLPYKESTVNIIYLIDFGLAKVYIDPVTETHIEFSRHAGMVGTCMFMSANSHEETGL